MMKIVISDTPPYFLAPDAPVLGATEVTVDGRVSWHLLSVNLQGLTARCCLTYDTALVSNTDVIPNSRVKRSSWHAGHQCFVAASDGISRGVTECLLGTIEDRPSR